MDKHLSGEGVTETELPTLLDDFYFEWAKDTLKRNLPFQNEVLRHVTTLSVALLGGGVALSGQKLLNPAFLVIALDCFLAALIAAFFGMLPYNGAGVDITCPDEIREHKAKAT